jgi:hypothetical protein
MDTLRQKSLCLSRRCAHLGLAFVLTTALFGCMTNPSQPAPVATSYNEMMTSANEAVKKAAPAEALGFLSRAAKLEPAKKEPWVQMAKMHFEAHNYGATISACNEVLVRDNADIWAKSTLAVSGLRVTTNALEQLRAVNEFNGNPRQEAQSLARLLHVALGGGGSILLDGPTPPRAAPARPKPVISSRSVAQPQPAPPPAASDKPVNPFK